MNTRISEIFHINGEAVLVEFDYTPFVASRAFEEPDSPEEIDIHSVLYHGVDVTELLSKETFSDLEQQISEGYKGK